MKRWIPLMVGLAIAGSVMAAMMLEEDPVPPAFEPIVEAPLPPPPRPQIAVIPPEPPKRDTELPDRGLVHVEGQGLATVVPTNPATAPSPEAERPLPQVNPNIPSELPQTPEWRLQKTHQTLDLLKQRLAHLDQARQQARLSGDAEELQKAETRYLRFQERLTKVEGEANRLKLEVAGAGGP